jgi:hypothetical protein
MAFTDVQRSLPEFGIAISPQHRAVVIRSPSLSLVNRHRFHPVQFVWDLVLRSTPIF